MNKPVFEYPVTENTALYYNEQHSRLDEQAEALRRRILDAPDTLRPKEGGKTYHISYRGDDAADGLTPATAWLTVNNLRGEDAPVKAGDLVLFERGGVYHDAETYLVNGASYGAYGEGPKPQLFAGDKNYADPALWEQTEHYAIWRAKVPTDRKNRDDGIRNDIGNIIFDHGRGCSSDFKRLVRSELSADFEFYHDIEEDYLYLYHSMGNPGARFSSIEIAPRYGLLVMDQGEDIIIENLCAKYAGGHAVWSMMPKNVVIRGCEIGYIGGSLLLPSLRYGNGIEFYACCSDMVVENNWIYQCFDAGYTHQGPNGWHENLCIRGNLIEYCNYNIEVWTAKDEAEGGSRNVVIEDNFLRFAGYGFGTKRRTGSNSSAVGNISLYNYALPHKDVVIKNNVFDCSTRYLVSVSYPNDAEGRGPTIKGNIWNQKAYHTADSIAAVDRLVDENGKDYDLLTFSQEDMDTHVPLVDLTPVEVTFEK